jgi:DNA invertase Pin-like site-specific DNA recombinase
MNGQNLQSQLDQLKAAGVTKIFQEQPEGVKLDRSQLDKLMADIRKGDTVVITSLDRIAHNTKHLLDIVESLNTAGVTFKVIDNGIDTSTPHGKVIPMLLGAITNFERQIVRKRQAEGIDKAKREGRYKGRKPTAMAKTEEVLSLNIQGLTRQKIADQLGIGVASVYRILKNHATSQKKQNKPLKKSVDKQKRVSKHELHPVQLSLF